MEFHIENTKVYGLNESIIQSGNSYRVEMSDSNKEPTEKDLTRAFRLGNTKGGEGHDQFLCGIRVNFDMYAPLYMWKEIQRYKFLDFVSSQSTMHCLDKFNLANQCTSDTDQQIIDTCQKLIDCYNNMIMVNRQVPKTFTEAQLEKGWRTMIASLPCGFVLGASMSTNYRQLKTMYFQRRDHRLKEWYEFCRWCETLPLFKELIIGGNNNE